MSSFSFDEAGNVALLPKELGENVTSMLEIQANQKLQYIVGGQAELNAEETLSLDDMGTGQAGGTIRRDRVRVVHAYLIETMREMKIDEAVIAGAVQHCAEFRTARGLAGGKAPPAGQKRKCSCCVLQ